MTLNNEINELLLRSHTWMETFLIHTQKIPKEERSTDLQQARSVIYDNYSSIDDLYLDCKGSFDALLQLQPTPHYLLIHMHMALTLFNKRDLLEPFIHDLIQMSPEKYRRWEKCAQIAVVGKKLYELMSA